MLAITCSQNHTSALLPDVSSTGNKAIEGALSQAQKELFYCINHNDHEQFSTAVPRNWGDLLSTADLGFCTSGPVL